MTEIRKNEALTTADVAAASQVDALAKLDADGVKVAK